MKPFDVRQALQHTMPPSGVADDGSASLGSALRNIVSESRSGQVLGRGTILKVDFYSAASGRSQKRQRVDAESLVGGDGQAPQQVGTATTNPAGTPSKSIGASPISSSLDVTETTPGLDSSAAIGLAMHTNDGSSAGFDDFDDGRLVIAGAPRWRGHVLMRGFGQEAVEDRLLGACGQPTVSGARAVCNLLRQVNLSPSSDSATPTSPRSRDVRPLAWVNTRQEPIIYVNNRPMVLREMEHARRNVPMYAGLTAEALERMEERLKEDVLAEAELFHGNILIHDEDPFTNEVIPCFESVDAASVLTPREVFQLYVASTDDHGGLGASRTLTQIIYRRLPLTPERSPTPKDFDMIVSFVSGLPEHCDIMFNCQLGRSRSSWAMSVTAIWWVGLQRRLANGHHGEIRVAPSSEAILRKHRQHRPFGSAMDLVAMGVGIEAEEEALCVQSLTGLFSGGRKVKVEADALIELCASNGGTDLRQRVFASKRHLEQARTSKGETVRKLQFVTDLDRYFKLLAFNQCIEMWAKGANGDGPDDRHDPLTALSFSSWYEARPELNTMLAEARRTPEDQFSKFDARASISASVPRTGAVLTRGTILKVDVLYTHADEQESRLVDELFPFSQIDEFSLFTCATGSTDQIERLLHRVCDWKSFPETSGSLRSSQVLQTSLPDATGEILWINLREEPVTVVGGTPFVLRSSRHPYHNLRTYAGILPENLENLERRLKSDVVAEATFNDGKILVHDETGDQQIVEQWLSLDESDLLKNPDAHVKTLREVFEGVLKPSVEAYSETRFNLAYCRIPVTAGSCPEEKDFDQLVEAFVAHAPRGGTTVFSCQKGSGRSIMAMAAFYMLYSSSAGREITQTAWS